MADWLAWLPYDWLKVGHILAFVSWMAGLFYLPRLFVYHAERAPSGTETDAVLRVMEDKLLRLIMRPAMIATWAFGLLMAAMGGFDWGAGWAWGKIAAVLGMTAFHWWCARAVRTFAEGRNVRAGRHYRIMNEVPTLLLIIIVIAVIVRPF